MFAQEKTIDDTNGPHVGIITFSPACLAASLEISIRST